jgi:hypothetical protein
MTWRFFPKDYFSGGGGGGGKHDEKDECFLLDSVCCKVFNEASKKVLDVNVQGGGIKFSQALAEEMARRDAIHKPGTSYLSVVSSRFAVDFKEVLASFVTLLYCGLTKANPEECIYYTAQFYEAVTKMQSLRKFSEDYEIDCEWTKEETLGTVIKEISTKAVCHSYYISEEQRVIQKQLEDSVKRYCEPIVVNFTQIAYAEDRETQCKFIHCSFFLVRDIIEDMLRDFDFDEETRRGKLLKKNCNIS